MLRAAERELYLQLRRIRKAEYLAYDRYFEATAKGEPNAEADEKPNTETNGDKPPDGK